ncbi:GntR family transcriptional regulator [Actinomadura formosensis]
MLLLPSAHASTIRDRITRGEYLPDNRLPSQLELAAEFHVANRTVALAMAVLRAEGYVWTQATRAPTSAPRNTGAVVRRGVVGATRIR